MSRTEGRNPDAPPLTLLSVVIPAHDEEGCIGSTVQHVHVELCQRGIPHEIVVVDDGSTDRTWEILQGMQAVVPTLRPVRNSGPNGFGRAVVYGINAVRGYSWTVTPITWRNRRTGVAKPATAMFGRTRMPLLR